MNQDESIALFKRCEAARAEARAAGKDDDAAHEAAKAVWNAWAGEMLAERKTLEDAGEWAAEIDWAGDLQPKNDATRAWMEAAAVDFFRVRFAVALAPNSEQYSSVMLVPAPANQSATRGGVGAARSIFVEDDIVRFDGFVLPGEAKFERAQFYRTAWFPGAHFSGNAQFKGAQFGGDAQFRGAQFGGDARFEGAQFNGSTQFKNAQFGRDARFERAQFSNTAGFGRAQFSGNAGFTGAKFSGIARFGKVRISGVAGFGDVQFSGSAWFSDAQFDGNAEFRGVQFGCDAQFESAQFSGDAQFESAQFSDDAQFESAQFGGNAGFGKATFTSDARFDGATFTGNARFLKATFTGTAWFLKATFTGDAGFGIAQFATNAFFHDVKFCGDASFFLATFKHLASFANARFRRQAKFGAIRGERAFSLAGAEFDGVPDFIQAHFEEAPRLDNVKVRARIIARPPITPFAGMTKRVVAYLVRAVQGICRRTFLAHSDDEWRNYPARFRTLRRLAIQGHDSDREHYFFGGEIRTAWLVTDWPLPLTCPKLDEKRWPHLKWLNWLPLIFWRPSAWISMARFGFSFSYELLGGLGTSLIRPLMWWGLMLFAAATLYLGENPEMIHERQILQQRDGASSLSAYAQSTAAAWFAPRACYAPPPPANKSATEAAPNTPATDTPPHVGALSASVRAGTDAPTEALHLAFRNAFIVLDGGADAAHRTYGCLYGVELFGGSNPVTVVPPWVSAVSAAQKLVSALFIFLFGLAVRNMLKMK